MALIKVSLKAHTKAAAAEAAAVEATACKAEAEEATMATSTRMATTAEAEAKAEDEATNGRARLGILCHCSWGEPCTGTTGTNRSNRDHMVTIC